MKVKETTRERYFSIEDLSEYEAGVLLKVMGNISGDHTTNIRNVTSSLYHYLNGLGIEPQGVVIHSMKVEDV